MNIMLLIFAAPICVASGGGIRGRNKNYHEAAVISTVISAGTSLPEGHIRQLQRGHGNGTGGKAKGNINGKGNGHSGGGNKKKKEGDEGGGQTTGGGGGGWGFGFGGGSNQQSVENGDEESGTGFGDDDNAHYSGYGYGGGSTTVGTGGTGGYGSSSSGSSYGSSSNGGSSSYGSSSYGSSSSSYGSSYGSSYSSSRGGYSHSSSYRPTGGGELKVQIPLLPVLLLLGICFPAVTLYTAHAFEYNAEGTYANFCRLQLNCMSTVYSFLYNLWHCRLGEVADVVCAMDDEDEYGAKFTDEELERMNPRKGLDRALEMEHKRAVRKARKAGRGEGSNNGAPSVEMNRLR